MKSLPKNRDGSPLTNKPLPAVQAATRTAVLVPLSFLAGIALCAAVWFAFNSGRHPAGETTPAIELSAATRDMLNRLESPLEIHFYDLLDPASVPESVRAFAGRAESLLAAYQQAANGKIKVSTINAQSNPNPNAAIADGITAFNLDKGEGCFLGVALLFKGRRETLPRLVPEWEQALEPDLTRAIARLLEGAGPAPGAVAVVQTDTNVIKEVKALIPNLADVTVEEGTRILREAALKDFTAAAKEMERQVKEAEQGLGQAQNGGSEADKQAAMKHLQQVQMEQTEMLKQIAAKSQAQIAALQQLKAAR
jgi:hypothetical protein